MFYENTVSGIKVYATRTESGIKMFPEGNQELHMQNLELSGRNIISYNTPLLISETKAKSVVFNRLVASVRTVTVHVAANAGFYPARLQILEDTFSHDVIFQIWHDKIISLISSYTNSKRYGHSKLFH